MGLYFFVFVRLIGVLVLVALRSSLMSDQLEYLFFSILLTHYFLGFVYSRRQIRARMLGARSLLRFSGLMGLASGFFLLNFPKLPLYFGVHHVLSDGYLPHQSWALREPGRKTDPRARALLVSRLLLTGFIYLVVLREGTMGVVSPQVWEVCLLASIGVFLWALWGARELLGMGDVFAYLAFEAIGVGVAALSFRYEITVENIIFYHLIFWLVWPLPGFFRQSSTKILIYLAANAAIGTCLFMLTPVIGIPFKMSDMLIRQQVDLWGYFHITSSFALSVLNPGVIRRFFAPSPGLEAV